MSAATSQVVSAPATMDLRVQAMHSFKRVIEGLVKMDVPDLTARQLAVFLLIYMEREQYTIRSLAERLQINKPAVTRGIDRLEEIGLCKRVPDPTDRRSLFVGKTAEGTAHLRRIAKMIGG